MQSYIYQSNFAKAMRRGGEIWLSQKRDICIEDEREVKTVDRDGNVGSGKLRVFAPDEDGVVGIQNDLDNANFDALKNWIETSITNPENSPVKAAKALSVINGLKKKTGNDQQLKMFEQSKEPTCVGPFDCYVVCGD